MSEGSRRSTLHGFMRQTGCWAGAASIRESVSEQTEWKGRSRGTLHECDTQLGLPGVPLSHWECGSVPGSCQLCLQEVSRPQPLSHLHSCHPRPRDPG